MPDWFRMQCEKAGRRFKLTDIIAVNVIVLHRGHLVASGSADDLRAAHSRPDQGLLL